MLVSPVMPSVSRLVMQDIVKNVQLNIWQNLNFQQVVLMDL